jgi:hypothetical protein
MRQIYFRFSSSQWGGNRLYFLGLRKGEKATNKTEFRLRKNLNCLFPMQRFNFFLTNSFKLRTHAHIGWAKGTAGGEQNGI